MLSIGRSGCFTDTPAHFGMWDEHEPMVVGDDHAGASVVGAGVATAAGAAAGDGASVRIAALARPGAGDGTRLRPSAIPANVAQTIPGSGLGAETEAGISMSSAVQLAAAPTALRSSGS